MLFLSLKIFFFVLTKKHIYMYSLSNFQFGWNLIILGHCLLRNLFVMCLYQQLKWYFYRSLKMSIDDW